MKLFLYILPLILLNSKCSSQSLSDDEIKQNAHMAAIDFGKALLEHDFRKLYNYSPKESLDGISMDEFIKNAEDFQSDEEEVGIVFNEIKTTTPKKIANCNKQYQVLMDRTIFANFSGKPRLLETRLVALSSDGINWVFEILSRSQDIESVKKMYPYFCEEIFENW